MCNCGNKRSAISTQHQPAAQQVFHNNISDQHFVYSNFEYTGKTALTAIGNVSGRKYRFSYPGDVQAIDRRDEPGMLGIPVLKKR
ncbi:MAG TPA: hypothetical protein PKM63_02575 [Panacibacter sp.]|nr:hypothetical protein [Panacibacter sp.]HNP43141.1 hypothetical protein [Panacibacter sp.]